MNNLGAIFPNSGPVTYTILPAQVSTETAANTNDYAKQLISQILITPKGQQIVNRFLTQKPGFWRPILANQKLTPSQKFKKIFGVDFLDIFFQNGQGLGNIFEDIGNWFNNGGAERLALQIQNTSSSVAQALNILRNKENNINTQQNVQDFQTNAFLKTSDFLQNYGWLVIGGLGLLLILKK